MNKQATKSSRVSAVDVERALWIRAIIGVEEIDSGSKIVTVKEADGDRETCRDIGNENDAKSIGKSSEKGDGKSKGKRKSSPIASTADSSRTKKSRL